MSTNDQMKIERWAIGDLKPYEKHARAHKDEHVRKLADGFVAFGMNKPILIDADGVIVAGHKMWIAAKLNKYDSVPVVVLRHLSPEQIRAYRLADNRTGLDASWIDDVLAAELQALKDLDFDLGLTGFDSNELDRILNPGTAEERAEETPEVPENPLTVAGDVWILGKHRIICGSSTDADTVGRLLTGVKPHLMVTDPPYGVEYDANWRNDALRNDGSAVGGRATGKVMNDDVADWREAWALFPGSVAYVWHAGIRAGDVYSSLAATGFKIRSQIIWVKQRLVLSRGDYHWQHEPCAYVAKSPKDAWQERFDDDHDDLAYAVKDGSKADYHGGRKQSTIWNIDHRKSETGHSTQKPIECMKRPILNNSSQGQAVYEPFSGSGTTIMACELTGRICYAVELNPPYVDVAVERFASFAGGARRGVPGARRQADPVCRRRCRAQVDRPQGGTGTEEGQEESGLARSHRRLNVTHLIKVEALHELPLTSGTVSSDTAWLNPDYVVSVIPFYPGVPVGTAIDRYFRVHMAHAAWLVVSEDDARRLIDGRIENVWVPRAEI